MSFPPCSNYSDGFSYISILNLFPLHKDYGQDGADDDDDDDDAMNASSESTDNNDRFFSRWWRIRIAWCLQNAVQK